MPERGTLPRLPSVCTAAPRNIDVGMGKAMGMGWKERTCRLTALIAIGSLQLMHGIAAKGRVTQNG